MNALDIHISTDMCAYPLLELTLIYSFPNLWFYLFISSSEYAMNTEYHRQQYLLNERVRYPSTEKATQIIMLTFESWAEVLSFHSEVKHKYKIGQSHFSVPPPWELQYDYLSVAESEMLTNTRRKGMQHLGVRAPVCNPQIYTSSLFIYRRRLHQQNRRFKHWFLSSSLK